jgi:hypothetical protein
MGVTEDVPCFDTRIPVMLSWPLSSFFGDVYCIVQSIIYNTTMRLITVVFLDQCTTNSINYEWQTVCYITWLYATHFW